MTDRQTGYPSVDKPWDRYYTDKDKKIVVPECTVYQNIYDRNKDYLDGVALNYYGNKIKYKKIFLEIEKCAKTLCHIGIKRGDCVNLCTAGIPEAMYVVLACSRIGAIANFISPLFTKEQMIERINDTEADWILILDAMYGFIKEALPKTCIKNVVIIPATNSVPEIIAKLLYLKSDARKILKKKAGGGQKYYSWKEYLRLGKTFSGSIDVPYERNAATIMVYSSGSTGASKGILLTNDGINSTIANYQTEGFPYNRGDAFLQMIPIWFSTGIVLSMLMPLAMGIEVILEPKFSKESFVNDLKKYKPTMTLAATSLWIHAVSSKELDGVDFSRMDYPITGGEKILPQDEKRMHSFLMEHGCKSRMIKGYGMCELGGTVSTSTSTENYSDKLGGTGYPILNVIVSAFKPGTDVELKYGEHGEIRVCTPARMKGYYKNPKATDEFFRTDSEGRVWGCTGDIGYVDEDGEVFVCGRATDHYQRDNGEIIYLFDIEDVILRDEAVNQCKVVDTEIDGKTVLVAHIVLREGKDETVLKRINGNLRTSFPNYMVPEYYKIRQSMPVHSNGKRDVGALKSDKEGLKKTEYITGSGREIGY